MTQRTIILKVLQDYGDWMYSHQLSQVDTKYGFIGSEGKRRCRELCEDGLIEATNEGKYVKYRAKEVKRTMYKEVERNGVRVRIPVLNN